MRRRRNGPRRCPNHEGHRRPGAVHGPRGRACRRRLRHPGRCNPARLRPADRLEGPPRPHPTRAGRRPRGRGLRLGDREGRRVLWRRPAQAAATSSRALADAKMDSVPIVAITGQVPTPAVGNDAFQEADITGITLSVTKHNFLVKDANELAGTVREAFHIASTGRPGPVLIDLPKDVQLQEITWSWPETVIAARLQAHDEGPPWAGRARPSRLILAREAAGPLRGRRRDQGERHEGAVELAAERRPAGRHHADGSRRVPRHARALPAACPVCTATTRPSPRCRRRTC